MNIPILDNGTLSASVEIQTNPMKGRYAVASEDIKIGSMIAVEEPITYILNPDDPSLILEFCHHCLRPCPFTFVPCKNCASVLFCSITCREEAHRRTHRYECEIDLYGMRSRSNASSFRIFLALQAVLQYPMDKLDDIENSKLMEMVSHDQEQEVEDELKNLSITILVLVLLRKTSYHSKEYLKDDVHPDNLSPKELKLAEIINHLLRVQNFNTHPILTTHSTNDNLSSNRSDLNVGLSRLGDCMNVTIASSFNHSCNPNTLRINSVGPPRTYLIASRNIAKGKLPQN